MQNKYLKAITRAYKATKVNVLKTEAGVQRNKTDKNQKSKKTTRQERKKIPARSHFYNNQRQIDQKSYGKTTEHDRDYTRVEKK